MSLIPVAAGAPFGRAVTIGIATTISMVWISVAAGLDRQCRRLPDALVVLALLPTATAAAVLTLQGSATAVTGIGCGAAAWGLPLLFVHVLAPAGVGFGDVKAGGAIGATLGLTQSVTVTVCSLVACVAVAVVTARCSRRGDLALGPFLTLGALACLAVAMLARELS